MTRLAALESAVTKKKKKKQPRNDSPFSAEQGLRKRK